jgi:3-hydroxy-3-methylglutaryl CoA synthase
VRHRPVAESAGNQECPVCKKKMSKETYYAVVKKAVRNLFQSQRKIESTLLAQAVFHACTVHSDALEEPGLQ